MSLLVLLLLKYKIIVIAFSFNHESSLADGKTRDMASL